MNPIRHLIVPVCQMEVPSVPICFFKEPFSPCLLKTFSRTPSFFSMHSPEAIKPCWDNQVCQTLFTYSPMVQMILFFLSCCCTSSYSQKQMLTSVRHCISVSFFCSLFLPPCSSIFCKCCLLQTVVSTLPDLAHCT